MRREKFQKDIQLMSLRQKSYYSQFVINIITWNGKPLKQKESKCQIIEFMVVDDHKLCHAIIDVILLGDRKLCFSFIFFSLSLLYCECVSVTNDK